MANGLIGGFGSFGQAQGQTQGNLLGGVFQQQPTRGELRRGLLSELVQQYGGNAQQTGGAAIGAGLGIGISKLLGRDVQGAERADKIRRVQEQVNSQFGDQFASDPYSAFTGTAQALFDEGLVPEANAALQQAANYKPEPQELPADAQNLAFRAQQAGLVPGTPEYQEFMRTGGEIEQGPTTTVNVGQQGQQFPDPPKDTVWARDEQGNVLTEEREVNGRTVRAPVSVPITGSKPAREAEEERREREFSARSANRAASIVVDDFDFLLRGLGADPETGEIRENAEQSVVGPRMRMAAEQGTLGTNVLFAGGGTGDFLRQLESARNTIAVDQLLNIKREGSGLGQVPQSQLNTLSTLLGSLEAGLSNDKLAENLARAKRLYTNIIETSLQDVDDPTFRGEVLDIAGMAEERGVLDENNGGQNDASSPEGEVVDWSDL